MVRLEKDWNTAILSLVSPLNYGTIPCDYHCSLFFNDNDNDNFTFAFGLATPSALQGLVRPLLHVVTTGKAEAIAIATAREHTFTKTQSSRLRHLLQELGFHDRLIITTATATTATATATASEGEGEGGRQYRRAAARVKHKHNCRAQALNRGHLVISPTCPSPPQNSSSSSSRVSSHISGHTSTSLGLVPVPVPVVLPADQHLQLHLHPLELHHRPHLHLQRPPAHVQSEEGSILPQLRRKPGAAPGPHLTYPTPVTHSPRPKGIEAVSAATGLFQRLHTLRHRTTIDQLNSPP